MTKDICERLAAILPFVVHAADGREYGVPTSDDGHVSPAAMNVSAEFEVILAVPVVAQFRR